MHEEEKTFLASLPTPIPVGKLRKLDDCPVGAGGAVGVRGCGVVVGVSSEISKFRY